MLNYRHGDTFSQQLIREQSTTCHTKTKDVPPGTRHKDLADFVDPVEGIFIFHKPLIHLTLEL